MILLCQLGNWNSSTRFTLLEKEGEIIKLSTLKNKSEYDTRSNLEMVILWLSTVCHYAHAILLFQSEAHWFAAGKWLTVGLTCMVAEKENVGWCSVCSDMEVIKMILNVPCVNLSIFRFHRLCSLVKSSLSQVCSSHTWGL